MECFSGGAVQIEPITNHFLIKETAMKSYKEHTPLERANMSYEEVEGLLKIELMEAGIVEMEEPEAPPEPEEFEPVIQEKVYQPSVNIDYPYALSFGFLDEEDARAFSEMKILLLDQDYSTRLVTAKKPKGSTAIGLVGTVSKDELTRARKADKEDSEAEKAYKNELAAYEEYKNRRDEVLQPVWEDWREMGRRKARSQRIVDVYEDYLKTCDGDAKLAVKFLRKAYSDQAVIDAYDFLQIVNPLHWLEEEVVV